jgi:hypothetical protein
MLAEKFMLLLETIVSNRYPDNSPRVITKCRHVPIRLAGRDSEVNPLNVVVPYRRPYRDEEDRRRAESKAAKGRQEQA